LNHFQENFVTEIKQISWSKKSQVSWHPARYPILSCAYSPLRCRVQTTKLPTMHFARNNQSNSRLGRDERCTESS